MTNNRKALKVERQGKDYSLNNYAEIFTQGLAGNKPAMAGAHQLANTFNASEICCLALCKMFKDNSGDKE